MNLKYEALGFSKRLLIVFLMYGGVTLLADPNNPAACVDGELSLDLSVSDEERVLGPLKDTDCLSGEMAKLSIAPDKEIALEFAECAHLQKCIDLFGSLLIKNGDVSFDRQARLHHFETMIDVAWDLLCEREVANSAWVRGHIENMIRSIVSELFLYQPEFYLVQGSNKTFVELAYLSKYFFDARVSCEMQKQLDLLQEWVLDDWNAYHARRDQEKSHSRPSKEERAKVGFDGWGRGFQPIKSKKRRK